MNELVERVARAICVEDGVDPDGHEHGLKACNWTANRDVARAAIAAMREPTEAMVEAASGSIARWAWPAMIDAALADHD